ncbi:MAG TPA: hypothetical protein VMV77_08945 [Bacteroidales bacterium]|nr:hypothetical protein [Bacteroidales bacterium]
MRKVNMIEMVEVVSILLFAIVISLYHISYEGYLGLSDKSWAVVWALSVNGLLLTFALIICSLTIGVLKMVCKWVLIPYFILKLIYHISCFAGIYLLSLETWSIIWSFALVGLIITGLIACVNIMKNVD